MCVVVGGIACISNYNYFCVWSSSGVLFSPVLGFWAAGVNPCFRKNTRQKNSSQKICHFCTKPAISRTLMLRESRIFTETSHIHKLNFLDQQNPRTPLLNTTKITTQPWRNLTLLPSAVKVCFTAFNMSKRINHVTSIKLPPLLKKQRLTKYFTKVHECPLSVTGPSPTQGKETLETKSCQHKTNSENKYPNNET